MKFRFCGDLDCPDWVLAEINTLSKMSSIRLKVLVSQIIVSCLAGEMNYEKIRKLAADNDGVSDIKGAVASIHFIITNSAKYDIDDKVLIQEIQQLGLPKENSDTIAKLYRESKDDLAEKLAKESYRISKLVSTDWRVDQVVVESASDDKQEPRFVPQTLIQLKLAIDNNPTTSSEELLTSNNRDIQELSMEMTAEELDVLVYELTQVQQMMQNLSN